VRALLSGGLAQGCSLPSILFITFMDRISELNQGPEGFQFGQFRIDSLLLADELVPLDSWSRDLLHSLSGFSFQCEAAEIRVSTCKSEGGGLPTL